MPVPDIQEMLRLHLAGMAQLRELLEQCERERNTGQLAAARRTFRRAERIRMHLEALEEACRPKTRG